MTRVLDSFFIAHALLVTYAPNGLGGIFSLDDSAIAAFGDFDCTMLIVPKPCCGSMNLHD